MNEYEEELLEQRARELDYEAEDAGNVSFVGPWLAGHVGLGGDGGFGGPSSISAIWVCHLFRFFHPCLSAVLPRRCSGPAFECSLECCGRGESQQEGDFSQGCFRVPYIT